jgi:hypothetical protein
MEQVKLVLMSRLHRGDGDNQPNSQKSTGDFWYRSAQVMVTIGVFVSNLKK